MNENFRNRALILSRSLLGALKEMGLEEKSLRRMTTIVEDAVWGRPVRFTSVACDLGEMMDKLPDIRGVRLYAMLNLLRAAEEFAVDNRATADALSLLTEAERFAGFHLDK